MSFVYDGSSGSLSNGTTLTGIEKVEYFGGSGDDDVAISGALTGADGTPSVSLAAGDGYDTLAADLSDGVQSNDVISLGLDNGVISGTAPGISLSGFEEVTFTGDVHDTASLSLLPLDGGVEVSVQPDGTLMTNVGVTLLNYDSFVIQTGEGDDTIVAGANNDTIIGGGGGDATWGGTGADTFAFLAAEDFGSGPLDWIRDFSSTEGDKIDLQGVAAGEFAFIGGAGFSGGGVAELRYEDIGGGPNSVQGDLDGDGVADFSFLVSSSVPLSETDFFL
jgi:Ca2+-binding RTX toxin-like protein